MKQLQKFRSTRVTYDLTKPEIEALIKEHYAAMDGSINWDITANGKVRGASLTVFRTEISGDLIIDISHQTQFKED